MIWGYSNVTVVLLQQYYYVELVLLIQSFLSFSKTKQSNWELSLRSCSKASAQHCARATAAALLTEKAFLFTRAHMACTRTHTYAGRKRCKCTILVLCLLTHYSALMPYISHCNFKRVDLFIDYTDYLAVNTMTSPDIPDTWPSKICWLQNTLWQLDNIIMTF